MIRRSRWFLAGLSIALVVGAVTVNNKTGLLTWTGTEPTLTAPGQAYVNDTTGEMHTYQSGVDVTLATTALVATAQATADAALPKAGGTMTGQLVTAGKRIALRQTGVTTPFAATAADDVIYANAGGAQTVQLLPTASVGTNAEITVVNGNVGGQDVTILPDGAEQIDGGASYVLSSLDERVRLIAVAPGVWSVIATIPGGDLSAYAPLAGATMTGTLTTVGQAVAFRAVSATPDTPAVGDYYLKTVGATSVTINLPAAADKTGRVLLVCNAGTGETTIARAGADLINGAATLLLPKATLTGQSTLQNGVACVQLISEGTSWAAFLAVAGTNDTGYVLSPAVIGGDVTVQLSNTAAGTVFRVNDGGSGGGPTTNFEVTASGVTTNTGTFTSTGAVTHSSTTALNGAVTVADDTNVCFGDTLDACCNYDELTNNRFECTYPTTLISVAGGISIQDTSGSSILTLLSSTGATIWTTSANNKTQQFAGSYYTKAAVVSATDPFTDFTTGAAGSLPVGILYASKATSQAVTLPAAAGIAASPGGRCIVVKCIGTASTCTVSAVGGDLIDGAASDVLTTAGVSTHTYHDYAADNWGIVGSCP